MEDSYIFGLNSQKDGVTVWGDQEFNFKHAELVMTTLYLNENL